MATLRIEHPISDFGTWYGAFGRFETYRKEGGVLHERITQPIDDDHYVFIELDFASVDGAQHFQKFLETQIWSNPENSPALDGVPTTRIATIAPPAR